MENLDELRSYVSDLIKVRGKTPSGIAVLAGVARGNLLRWVKGKPEGLGRPGVTKVLSVLGVVGGRLDPGRLHYFHVGGDRDPLIRVLKKEGEGESFSMVFLAPDVSSPKDFLTLGTVSPLLLSSREGLMIVIFPENFTGPAIQDVLVQNGCRWIEEQRKDPYYKHPTLRISRKDFDALKKEELDREQMTRFLSPSGPDVSWNDVLAKFQESGLTPREVLDLLKKRKGK